MELTQEIVNLKIDQFKSFGSKKREKDLNGKTKNRASETSGTISKGITCVTGVTKERTKKKKADNNIWENND